ncbi:MAG: hypothetical protein WBD90_22465, partial [Xanthobacteraceae bacterium]
TIMELTRQRLIESGLFGECPITVLPVTFYAFERLLAVGPQPAKIKNSLLLCTGSNRAVSSNSAGSFRTPSRRRISGARNHLGAFAARRLWPLRDRGPPRRKPRGLLRHS